MNRSPSANGAGSGASPAVVPIFQRALRSPPQHLINADQIDGGNAPIPRPKSPSECWLQAFRTSGLELLFANYFYFIISST